MKWKIDIKNLKKINPYVKKIFNGFALCLAVLMLIFTLIAINVNKDYDKGFLGYKFFIVLSDSMKPEFEKNDIVIAKVIDIKNLYKGDIISYYENNGIVVTHQIEDIVVKDSKKVFITKGINIDDENAGESQIEANKVIAKYIVSIPKGGSFLLFLKTKLGYAMFILIPLIIIIAYNGFKFYKQLKEYKKGKKNQDKLTKARLDEQIQQNKKLQDELAKMKEYFNIRDNNGE